MEDGRNFHRVHVSLARAVMPGLGGATPERGRGRAASVRHGVDVASEAPSTLAIDKRASATPVDPVLVAWLKTPERAGIKPFMGRQISGTLEVADMCAFSASEPASAQTG